MLSLPTIDDARRLRELFLDSGYTGDGISAAFGTLHPPLPDAGQRPGWLELTEEPSAFHLLARLFFLGVPVSGSVAAGPLPGWFLELCTDCGLLQPGGDGELRPAVLIAPHERLLVLSDLYTRLQSPESDHVLTVNPVARHLLNFTLRRPVETCLDLCAGSGIQALAAAAHSRSVVATDLNERAMEFARFNTRLNGCDNIECVAGSGYEPVRGRKFQLITCNPPFVLTPSTRFLYRDNPMELDLFCRQLTREAPAYLEEGGYYQMICEWVQVKDQPWEERLAEWCEGAGCDVWILRANTQLPQSYAERRMQETAALEKGGTPGLREWLEYYREREVEAIHGGLIALRRRSGKNWVRVEEIHSNLDEPFGEAIQRGFEARDFLEHYATDEALLERRFRLAGDARLVKDSVWSEGRWQTTACVELGLLRRTIGLEESLADFLTGFDGKRSLRELSSELTGSPGIEEKAIVSVVRALIERGVLRE